MATELLRADLAADGLDLEQIGEAAEIRASGTVPFTDSVLGWLVKVTVSRVALPEALARISSTRDSPIRSKTASIDEVTRFSP
ncbi:hypothetical protein [Nocardiopsis kunsanensis]|uniref:hypothetical protein n=1 Tax=Nocardiopsis kunsanensis TaxID=141693 RepID=UPI0018929D36|nr:hypothetical protein [Nocardiopsis kunsanensis]